MSDNFQLTFHGVTATPQIREHLEKRLHGIEHDQLIHIALEKEQHAATRITARANTQAGTKQLVLKVSAPDVYAAIDTLSDKLRERLRRSRKRSILGRRRMSHQQKLAEHTQRSVAVPKAE